jgi:hypothetical protein
MSGSDIIREPGQKMSARHPCGFPVFVDHSAKVRVARLTVNYDPDSEMLIGSCTDHTTASQGSAFCGTSLCVLG